MARVARTGDWALIETFSAFPQCSALADAFLCCCFCPRSLRSSQPPIHAQLPLCPPPPGRCPCFLPVILSVVSTQPWGSGLDVSLSGEPFLFSVHGFYCIYLQTLNFMGMETIPTPLEPSAGPFLPSRTYAWFCHSERTRYSMLRTF